MREKDFIEVIKNTTNSKYIGDDCAYLQDLGIVVTQDSLVEDVHFLREFITPYQLGFKSVMVNISDICASGAEPVYLTIALSLPADVDENFVKNFYYGARDAAGGAKIVGGDITGADKIYISVTAIGSVCGRRISSRKGAQPGQKVVVFGNHGSSGAGLRAIINHNISEEDFIKAHLMPQAQLEASQNIASNITEDYAMMDTSDGLMDALSTIANESGVLLDVDFQKFPHDKKLEKLPDWEELVLWGGEDYGLVATLPDSFGGTIVGEVKTGLGVMLNGKLYTKKDVENRLYKHFKE